MATYHFCAQGSDEWKQLRTQYVTSTDAAVVMGVMPAKYRTVAQLLAEKHGAAPALTASACMARGSAMEANGLAKYCDAHPENAYYAVGAATLGSLLASPDLLLVTPSGERGGVELKTPMWALRSAPPPYHLTQLVHAMGVCDLAWIDYVQYDPRVDAISEIRVSHDSRTWIEQRDICTAFAVSAEFRGIPL